MKRNRIKSIKGRLCLAALIALCLLAGCKAWTDAGKNEMQSGSAGGTGKPGAAGKPAPAGEAGSAGEPGPAGGAGPAEDPGVSGEPGIAGGAGPAADPGVAGEPGPTGGARSATDPGVSGEPGPAGEPGIAAGGFGAASDPAPAELPESTRIGAWEPVKLPPSYDYRQIGRAPQIGNQGSLGTCWAFASLTALESSVLPGERLELSVDHMSLKNSFSMPQDAGGEYTMSMAYLLAWQGPVPESEDPYGDNYSPDGLKPCLHVQEIQILPPKDYEAIKRAVYLKGGVQSSLYTSMRDYQSESVYYNRQTNSYCYMGAKKPNHDSVIVGWDDNYPKENFNMGLKGDGAFICSNSWGKDFGDQGYFYVSYYDTNIGVHNIVYTGVEPTDNYDHIYQSDLCGWVGQIGYGNDTAWFANAYTAGKGEILKAAGFYATDKDSSYELYVARHLGTDTAQRLSNPQPVGRGSMEYAGFYTVPLNDKIHLDDGEKFAIMVKITTPGTVHPVAIEYDAKDGTANVDLSDGEGYLSYDGKAWEHVEETQACNICLKAYTSDNK